MNKAIWALPRADRTKVKNRIVELRKNIQERYDKLSELLKYTDNLRKLNEVDKKELRTILDTYSDADKR